MASQGMLHTAIVKLPVPLRLSNRANFPIKLQKNDSRM